MSNLPDAQNNPSNSNESNLRDAQPSESEAASSSPSSSERLSYHGSSPDEPQDGQVDRFDHWILMPLLDVVENSPSQTGAIPVTYPEQRIGSSPADLDQMIPAQPSFMPRLDQTRFAIFGHYIQTTANSMANGATSSNPFLVQLLPLAVSSDLVLESILAQSCVHRAVRARSETESEAIVLYNKCLRSLRTAIGNTSTPESVDPLALTVSMLVLCFTETARGDVNGTIFYHLQAANSLLPRLLTLNYRLPKDLRDFLVEYYIYTSTSSIISHDPQASLHDLLCDQLLQEGQHLADSGYIGSLCGCWLELLLFIPRIFKLRQHWITRGIQNTTPDLVVEFSNIQSQLTQWEPKLHVTSPVALAGQLFRQSMLLYLHTILGKPSLGWENAHAATIQVAVTSALLCLEQLEATNQINTSLCWPIAVVGSCALCPQQRQSISNRLGVMAEAIGLGNITKTLEVLECMWLQEKAGPWEIFTTMEEAGIWISFA